jgi:hypothetical protein
LVDPERELPPVATRYTCVAFAQLYVPVMLNDPSTPDSGGDAIRLVEADFSPLVPTVYSWTVAPLTGC